MLIDFLITYLSNPYILLLIIMLVLSIGLTVRFHKLEKRIDEIEVKTPNPSKAFLNALKAVESMEK